jgi:D-amino-acid dehydrogenase
MIFFSLVRVAFYANHNEVILQVFGGVIVHIAVLGGGVIGITTAYALMQAGMKVTLIDRQSALAAECSYANGGQLSYSHGEPWATFSSLQKGLKWMFKDDAPLKLGFRLDAAMWRWTFAFMRECLPARVKHNAEAMLRLGIYSKQKMAEIEAQEPFDYALKKQGILHFFESKKTLQHNIDFARFQEKFGVPFEVWDRKACMEKEPALHAVADRLHSGVFFPIDESGDIRVFSESLAARLQQRGLILRLGEEVTQIVAEQGSFKRLVLRSGEDVACDGVVLCAGAYSPLLAKQLGIRLPIYPMKGYSISIPIKPDARREDVPLLSITDQQHKVVYSHLGSHLRLAGTAEFAGYNHTITSHRIAMLKRFARDTFPQSGDIEAASEWACLRPSTPDGPPIIDATTYRNVWLNTGHGTLGWTQAAGSAFILADLISGREPAIHPSFYRLARYAS